MPNWLRKWLADLVDRGASKNNATQWSQLWRTAIPVLSGFVALSDSALRLANHLFGLPGSVLPLSFAVGGVIWALYAVSAKSSSVESKLLHSIPASPQRTYRYDQVVRGIAKLALLPLIVLSVDRSKVFFEDLVPLPSPLYGYLVNRHTGAPVEAALVRVFDETGADVTTSHLASDSTGFYVVHTVRRVSRRATLTVSIPICESETLLPLFRAFESSVDAEGNDVRNALRPVFRHTVQCVRGTP